MSACGCADVTRCSEQRGDVLLGEMLRAGLSPGPAAGMPRRK